MTILASSADRDGTGTILGTALSTLLAIGLVATLMGLIYLLGVAATASYRNRSERHLTLGASLLWGTGYAIFTPLRLARAYNLNARVGLALGAPIRLGRDLIRAQRPATQQTAPVMAPSNVRTLPARAGTDAA